MAIESVEQAFLVATALIGRQIQQAVTGQHTELADSADPVVGHELTRFQVNKLHARSAGQDKAAGRLIPIAAMMVMTNPVI